jgi:RNA polymerase sigma factor (sigma-70 family)
MRTASASINSPSAVEAETAHWRERSGRLFAEFERPAKAMVRRAFRGAFSADEIDDIYSGAWLAVLRALANRERGLSDDEVRSYVLTSVANQASRELRRRRRKPTAPLELVGGAAERDHSAGPDEIAVRAESSQLTRDLLASLPPRRRAVMLLRYGWGLDPKQVCSLVANLSPRAYRKEISRGVDELTQKMRAVESGEWCADREPLLKAYVAGLASVDEERQAKAHLAHCRSCSGFVARLSGHLHELGGAVGAATALDALHGHVGLVERGVAVVDRARESIGGLVGRRDPTELGDIAGGVASSGAARGGGAAGAGLLAQLAGAGAAGKAALLCLGGGLAATACVAAGVSPLGLDRVLTSHPAPKVAEHEPHTARKHAPTLTVETLPSQVDGEDTAPPPQPSHTAAQVDVTAADDQPPAQSDEVESPVAESAPAVQQEFGVAAAAAPAQTPSSAATGGGGSGSASGGGDASAVQQEFGP